MLSGEIWSELVKSRMGTAGISILAVLAAMSVAAAAAIPADTLHEWNNPGQWIDLPKAAMPSWVNLFTAEKIPEHRILNAPATKSPSTGSVHAAASQFDLIFDYDEPPSDLIYSFEAEYEGSALLQMEAVRPDGVRIDLLSRSLPYLPERGTHSGQIFSADRGLRQNMIQHAERAGHDAQASAEEIIFSQADGSVLKGRYTFLATVYGTDGEVAVGSSQLIIGGKAYGLMGTDELRRDLAVGLLWGTPLALFIGIAVSVGSVAFGLAYGVYAAYRGRTTEEAMMRFNDVIYALPALPFLIILAVTISSSIFVMIGFLMIFGWVGIAKISRSMTLSVKTREFVQASAVMGQKNSRIIFRHIMPQLLPYAFASVAISVPAAITTEAGLSFLGLGDPAFPTWGQMLHDANAFGAITRGLWWWMMPPGIMIAVTGLAFVFIGNALDAIVNPRLRSRF